MIIGDRTFVDGNYHVSMGGPLPLSALLSQALVAFTIEFDSEFERRTPHRVTNHTAPNGTPDSPWLVSMAVWTKFLRFVPDEGVSIREFKHRAALTKEETKMWLTRLSRWGYTFIDKNSTGDSSNWLVRPTPGGQKALDVWRPLTGIIKKAGMNVSARPIACLRQSLQLLVGQLNPSLPDHLPILGYEMLSPGPDPEKESPDTAAPVSVAHLTLPMLLSRVLLALAIQYERESGLSLAISANVLRLVGPQGTRVRDLPRLSGVSKEAIAMALKRLVTAGLATVQVDPESKAKVVVLTAGGRRSLEAYHRILQDLEKSWEVRFGKTVIDLRDSLQQLVADVRTSSGPALEGTATLSRWLESFFTPSGSTSALSDDPSSRRFSGRQLTRRRRRRGLRYQTVYVGYSAIPFGKRRVHWKISYRTNLVLYPDPMDLIRANLSQAFAVLLLFSVVAREGHGAEPSYFVTYTHQLEEPGNLEVEMNSVTGAPGGNRFWAAATEFEYGVKAWWTTEVYLEGQTTAGDSTLFTGYRWENRFRVLPREHWINPLLYVEFENINGANKSLLEVVGHDGEADLLSPNDEARREKQREIEAKLILSSYFKGWTIAENFIVEKSVAHAPWEFGYALGVSRPMALRARPDQCVLCAENWQVGVEVYGGLGTHSDFGFSSTSQYVAPTVSWQIPNGPAFKLSSGFGVTNTSLPVLFRVGVSYEISQFGNSIRNLFRGGNGGGH